MTVVAVVPAKDRADSIGATVTALRGIGEVARVLVVDDGSTDATTAHARAAGAEVVRLPTNRGKGGAVAAGVAAAPDADVYLLVDADVGDTATVARTLLDPVLRGEADMSIGALPGAGRRGGFGAVKRLAADGIRRASGYRTAVPLSGQRAVRGDLLRGLELAPRFGLETALTIDAVRAGARVVEVPVAMEHRHTGRRLAGFRHRAGQGVDIARALWPRLTTARTRLVTIAVLVAVALAAVLWSGTRWEPSSAALGQRADKVVVFAVPHLALDDLDSGLVPNLDALRRVGAVAAMSVRTLSGRPSSAEAYATIGAGTRVRTSTQVARVYGADDLVDGGRAADATARAVGRRATGEVVVPYLPLAVRANSGRHLSSEPAALGEALRAAGRRTAVVGSSDAPGVEDVSGAVPESYRPAALALVDRSGSVTVGDVSRGLLRDDATAPFGVRFHEDAVLEATRRALATADVLVVDPGDLERAHTFRSGALDAAVTAAREAALRRTDALLGRLVDELPPRTLLVVPSVSPASGGWRLTPVVVAGPGVPSGYVQSPSTKRLGVVTLTDLAPTVLGALGVETPDGMIGHPLRYHAGGTDLEYLRRLDRDADYREGIYFPITVTYIVVQAALYVLAMLALGRSRSARLRGFLRYAVVAVAAFPLATFVFRAIPNVAALGDAGVAVLVAVALAIAAAACRARGHPLSPLAWVTWATAILIVVDVALGARLQYSSLLGYSLHTAARFFGVGNTAFAVLAASTVIAVCIHVAYAPRRPEALLLGGAFLAIVVVVDGAPSLGDDVGGILTLVPVFGLTMVALTGRRISWRIVGLVAVALAAVLSLAIAVDLLRPEESRTHLGRFVSDLLDGESGESLTTVLRKVSTNARVLGASVWTWMVPIAAVFALFLLVYLDRGAELLPKGSAVRAGVIAALAAGLVGFAVNDSGVVVTALVAVYVGPYLTLLALDADRGGPVRYPPMPAPSPTPTAPVDA